ncbi:MAG: TauD/TfdA family dioxygenase [Arenicellales bacterium]|jgi:taurine dioxygenase|nr:TauD/TfdA family dioxygenase [Arenicellales bacterium]MDP6392133.1 TauD/TfdA family dioxygenase [Arenicellales bacterium]
MPRVDYTTFDLHPMTMTLGAEIHGVDLGLEIAEDQFNEIRRAFTEFSVIFFRDQHLTPDQHIAFASRWGEINVNRFFKAIDSHPVIAEVRKEPDQETNIGGSWHTDHSYDQVPATGSILYARQVPEIGGDTQFASMYAAYDGLSDGLKRMLEPLRATHSSRHAFGRTAYRIQQYSDDVGDRLGNPDAATQDADHPVVIQHPLSGRKALYVNPGFTIRFSGWSDEESRPLLEYLYRQATKPEYTCRFHWQKNSLALWDNRATWHQALNDYPGQRRLMHRITIEGVPLE